MFDVLEMQADLLTCHLSYALACGCQPKPRQAPLLCDLVRLSMKNCITYIHAAEKLVRFQLMRAHHRGLGDRAIQTLLPGIPQSHGITAASPDRSIRIQAAAADA